MSQCVDSMADDTNCRPRAMTYTQPFFDLQIRFARKVAQLSGAPLAQVLLSHTNLYVRFGLGRGFNAEDPVWQRYLAGAEHHADALEHWTHVFYQSRLPERAPPLVVSSVGCFSYARSNADEIRLHFHNADGASGSPLAPERIDRRIEELRALFSLAKTREGSTSCVRGASWMYNLPAYRRLFPAEYLASATPTAPRFRNMPLWGQFVDRRGGLRQDSADAFVRRLAGLACIAELARCFPLQVLALESPAVVFYEHFAV
jgi:hypothetical protein